MPEMNKAEKLDAAVKGKGPESLPPLGYMRQEALKMREDNLNREIDELSDKLLLYSIDPSKLHDIDPEIAAVAYYDESDVPNAQPDRVYQWVEYSTRNPSDHGQHLTRAQSQGYKFITEHDPEAKGMHHCTFTSEGYLRWGSLLLMWIPRERYVNLRAISRRDAKQRRGEHLDATKLVELGDKYGVQVHTELPAEAMRQAKQQLAMRKRREAAIKRIDQRLRDGTAHLPGSK